MLKSKIIANSPFKRVKLAKNVIPSQNLPIRHHDVTISSPIKRKQIQRAERAIRRSLFCSK